MQTLREAGVPTIRPDQGAPGDAVFCSGTGLVDRAIQFGQWIRVSMRPYRKWNHIAWLDHPVQDDSGAITDWVLGQALSHGVEIGQLLSERGTGVEIVPLGAFPTVQGWSQQLMVDRPTHLATLRAEVGVKYGWLTIASVVVNILTPKWVRLDFRRANTFICSGLFSWALHSGGGLIEGDVYQVMPAQVAESTR